MDAHLTLKRRGQATSPAVAAGVIYSCGMALLLLIGCLFTWRRGSGALLTPLSPAALLLAAIFLVAASSAMIKSVSTWQSHATRSVRLGFVAAALSAMIFAASSLSLSGTSVWGQAALWLPVLVSVAGHTVLAIQRNSADSSARSLDRQAPSRTDASAPIYRVDAAHTTAVSAPHFPPEHVSQQLTRSTTDDGHDQCQGWIRANFDEGQRQQVVHLAFCPPFQTLPELSTTLADGQSVEVKHAQLMPYGARVELKRDRSVKGPSVALLRFSAVEVRAAS